MNSKLDYAAFLRGVRNKAERQQQVDKFVLPNTEETRASRKERGSSLTGGLSAGGQEFTWNLSRKKVVKGGFSVFFWEKAWPF